MIINRIMQSSRLAGETEALISGLKLKKQTYKLAICCLSEAVPSMADGVNHVWWGTLYEKMRT